MKRDPETELRELWTRMGVPAAKQDDLIRSITTCAQQAAAFVNRVRSKDDATT